MDSQIIVPTVGQLVEHPAADRHPLAVYLGRLSPGSRPTMRQSLDVVADWITSGRHNAESLDWAQLRYQHTAAIRAELARRYAPATANKVLSAVRGVLRECWRLGLVDAESYHRATDLEVVRGSTLPRGRALSTGEVRALFQSCAAARKATSAGAARDAALIAVAFGCGLRRAELVALDVADYTPAAREVRVIDGKGRKDRLTYAPIGAASALAAWLQVRGEDPGPMFCPVNKGDRIELRRMTPQAIMLILRRCGSRAGVGQFAPHDLRRTWISTLLANGADLAVVQRLAGHASPTTTARYDRRGEEAKAAAADLLNVPYC